MVIEQSCLGLIGLALIGLKKSSCVSWTYLGQGGKGWCWGVFSVCRVLLDDLANSSCADVLL